MPPGPGGGDARPEGHRAAVKVRPDAGRHHRPGGLHGPGRSGDRRPTVSGSPGGPPQKPGAAPARPASTPGARRKPWRGRRSRETAGVFPGCRPGNTIGSSSWGCPSMTPGTAPCWGISQEILPTPGPRCLRGAPGQAGRSCSPRWRRSSRKSTWTRGCLKVCAARGTCWKRMRIDLLTLFPEFFRTARLARACSSGPRPWEAVEFPGPEPAGLHYGPPPGGRRPALRRRPRHGHEDRAAGRGHSGGAAGRPGHPGDFC